MRFSSRFLSTVVRRRSIRETHKVFLDQVKGHGEGKITLEKNARIAVMTLNNSLKRNAVSGTMMNDLADIVDGLPSYRDGIAALIVTGAGNEAFCAGADFSLVKNVVNTPNMGVLMSRFMIDCFEAIRQSGLVSLCYINGSALGSILLDELYIFFLFLIALNFVMH
jgi:enoyl-CoA hydratase/carnithine racemase